MNGFGNQFGIGSVELRRRSGCWIAEDWWIFESDVSQ